MTRNFAARVLSVLGHPALLMPGAVVFAGLNKSAAPNVLIVAAADLLLFQSLSSVIVGGKSGQEIGRTSMRRFWASAASLMYSSRSYSFPPPR